MSTQDAAAQALLRRFVLTSDNRNLAISQAYELIRLQGMGVFLECIHHFTPELADEPWIFRGFMRELEERDGREATEAALQAAQQRSAPLDFLMRAALEDEKEETQPEIAQDYSALKARLNQETAFHFPRSWVEAASKADLEQAAADLLSETDDRKVIQYLMIFRRHPYPCDPNLLLPFLGSANRRLARRAADVIRLVRHGLVADVVGDMMKDGRLAIAALLLEGSRSLDDLLLMRRLLEQSLRDEEEYHSIGFSARQQIREVTGQEDTIREMLLHMYEHQPCSQCREHAVELLSERGGLPAWLVQEGQFDAVPHTAELCRTALAVEGHL